MSELFFESNVTRKIFDVASERWGGHVGLFSWFVVLVRGML